MENLTIGQLAERVGLNVETVRYYERRALIPEPGRSPSGYRQYGGDAVVRLRFIKRAQGLGFSLREISQLLSLNVDPKTTCQQVKDRAERKIADIDGKIEILEDMKRALIKLSAACRGSGPASDCPILDYLDSEADEIGCREFDA